MTIQYSIPKLPLTNSWETIKVLKELPEARAALAELKGVSGTIPNIGILINTLTIQEAKDSSEVENIVTSHDDLFKASLEIKGYKNLASKEVQHYASALSKGFESVSSIGLITNKIILNIHQELEQNNAGYRKTPGTKLVKDSTKEVVYIPPQHIDEIERHLKNLIDYMNDDSLQNIDPLIKMAIIHHQFESIHPFYDGNGRTGRIINILYLVAKELLDYPILYLSRYINQNKEQYYSLLQDVRFNGNWEDWILYILEGIKIISKDSIKLIVEIKRIMQKHKEHIRSNYPYYSQDLLNNLFKHPYTKIEFLAKDLKVNRKTAAKYLNEMSEDELNFLSKFKIGKLNYYVNNDLVQLLTRE